MQRKAESLTIDEKEYEEFTKWLSAKPDGFCGFTASEADFARQMFWLLADYPSFRKKMRTVSGSSGIFNRIQQFLKAKENESITRSCLYKNS